MSDLFDDFNKILKKDFLPSLVKYLKESDSDIAYNINSFIDDPQTFTADIFEKFGKNKDNNINERSYNNIENVTEINPDEDDDYGELYKRLSLIEDNMIQIEKVLKEKN